MVNMDNTTTSFKSSLSKELSRQHQRFQMVELYNPHKGVTRQNAESTKLRIVYDASAREKQNQP